MKAPERIYLIDIKDAPNTEGILWCEDSVGDDDVEYVRADLVVKTATLSDEQIYEIMEQAQVFASAWSLVGGVFDHGDALDTAEQEKANLRALLGERNG